MALLRCFDSHFCADTRSVRKSADAAHGEPVVAIPIVPIKQIVLVVEISNEQIDKAVIVVIAPGAALRSSAIRDDASGNNSRKCPITIVVVKKIVLVEIGHE